MTVKELIIELLETEDLNREVSIQVDKEALLNDGYRYDYLTITDIGQYGDNDEEIIFETEVEL